MELFSYSNTNSYSTAYTTNFECVIIWIAKCQLAFQNKAYKKVLTWTKRCLVIFLSPRRRNKRIVFFFFLLLLLLFLKLACGNYYHEGFSQQLQLASWFLHLKEKTTATKSIHTVWSTVYCHLSIFYYLHHQDHRSWLELGFLSTNFCTNT